MEPFWHSDENTGLGSLFVDLFDSLDCRVGPSQAEGRVYKIKFIFYKKERSICNGAIQILWKEFLV